jgi:hypothetical protein
MFSESGTSGEENPLHRTATFVPTAMSSNAEPNAALTRDGSADDFHSMKVRATLIGRMSRMWVYCSSLKARVNKDASGPHHRTTDRAPSAEKMSSGDLEIDSGFGLVVKI